MTTRQLNPEHQLFLQRLFAEHVMSDRRANRVYYDEICNRHENNEDEHGNIKRTKKPRLAIQPVLSKINNQLKKGFGLEIVTVILDGEPYHAVINVHADEVAKQQDQHFNPHERALIRLILQHFVAQAVDGSGSTDVGADDGDASPVLSIVCPRQDLVNLRSDLQEPYKLSLQQAEHVVDNLLDETWLRTSKRDFDAEDEDDDNHGGVDEDEDYDDVDGSNRRKRKRGTDDNRKRTNRRRTLQAGLELAPRTYLELSHVLVEMGMEQDELPQFIFHRDE